MRIRLAKLEHLISASGWWCHHGTPVYGLSTRFEPLAAFAVFRWEPTHPNIGEKYSELMTVGLTLSDLDRVLTETIPDQMELDAEALHPEIYHETDFEILGEQLKANVQPRWK